jgi:2-methylisocitrate lyase-like PEP mutase family enzyme
LYAPALKTLEQVRTVVGALRKPVNVLAPPMKNVTVAELSDAGVKRISIGGALARAVIATLLHAGREMRDQGTFAWTSDATPGSEINRMLGG